MNCLIKQSKINNALISIKFMIALDKLPHTEPLEIVDIIQDIDTMKEEVIKLQRLINNYNIILKQSL